MKNTENTENTEKVFIVEFKPNIEDQTIPEDRVGLRFKSKEEALAFIDLRNKELERLFDEEDFKYVKEMWERSKEYHPYYTFESYLIEQIEERRMTRGTFYLAETPM